jgi:thiamine biosynthesis lipoprotein
MFGISRESLFRRFNQSKSKTLGENDGWIKREETIMGTAISVELWCQNPKAAEEAINAVMDEMHRIDRLMSPHKADSELSRINRDAAKGPVRISVEMFNLLTRAAHFSQLSEGAFDITYAAVGRLFDYRNGIRPSSDAITKALSSVGHDFVVLDAKAQTVQFSRPGVCIDLGGFAKGHAVDNASALLRQHGIMHANVSAGGDSRVIGDRKGRPWMIGVRDPRSENGVVAVLPLEDTSISTSGDYERFFMEGDIRFHHLIDPTTGKSPDKIRSVTILAEDGLTTEALSKSVFVLGTKRGMELIESQVGVDAIIIDAEGALHYSSGLLDPDTQSSNGTNESSCRSAATSQVIQPLRSL